MAEQIFAFNDRDLETIKGLFADNEVMVNAVRNHMLSFPVSTEQAAALSMLNPNHREFLSRLFVPLANPENPLQRISDSWGSVDTSRGLDTFPFIYARQVTLDYLKERTGLLDGSVNEATLNLEISRIREVKSEIDELKSFAEIERRRVVYSMVDAQLALCVRLAGVKEESVEQTKERLMKDSTK